jgi:dienelactone hydrolase
VLWLWWAASFGIVGFIFSLVPGCLLLASGMSTLLWPGDMRIPQFTSLGGLLGIPFSLPVFAVAGPVPGCALLLLSAISWLTSGVTSLRQEPGVEEVPAPHPTARLAAKVAMDDALLASLAVTAPLPPPVDHRRIRVEVEEALDLYRERGWLEKPETYHVRPPALEDPELLTARVATVPYEHLRFESGYEPPEDMPGRERWLSRRPNRTAHAWVLRDHDRPRPWLVCIHGYQMGHPAVDVRAFRARRLYRNLGLNVALPVLPFHGPRRSGWRSGDGYITGDYLDLLHAEGQAMWDLRRILGWIRSQGAPAIGVYGLSLGGYNTALLAALEDGLACAVAGVPATDFTRLTWRHGPQLLIRRAEQLGIVRDDVQLLLSVVSPLVLPPRIPHEARYIFGGTADRLIPVDQVHDLWLHWGRPRVAWFQGSHLSFQWEPQVKSLLEEALGRLRAAAESVPEPATGIPLAR